MRTLLPLDIAHFCIVRTTLLHINVRSFLTSLFPGSDTTSRVAYIHRPYHLSKFLDKDVRSVELNILRSPMFRPKKK
jgi:hypothetical protein